MLSLDLDELARCLSKEGNLDEAETLLRQALTVRERVSPDDKSGIAGSKYWQYKTPLAMFRFTRCRPSGFR